MCFVIESDNLLANIFCIQHESTITIKRLKEIRSKLENEFPMLYIDITKHSLVKTIELNSDLYEWSDNTIKKVGNHLQLSTELVNDRYNWLLPENIRSTYVNSLTNALSGTL